MAIAVVSVPVSDQEAAKSFYTDIMQFRVLEDEPMGPTMRWLQLQPETGGATIGLVTWFEGMRPGGVQGLMLHVPDIEAEFDRLSAMGVEVRPLEAQPWGRFTTLSDPDGNGWIVVQLTEPGRIETRM